jgi:glycosyltransferase involved in cell wall biosynthesis
MHQLSRRLLIVEEALESLEIGHWYEHVKTIATACRAAKIDVTIAANRNASERVVQDLQALPLMPASAWSLQPSRNPILRYLGVLRHNYRHYQTVRRLLSKSEPFDCVFVPTVLVHHLLAWLFLVRRFSGRKFQRCVLFFLNPPGRYATDGNLIFPRSSGLMRQVLHRFQPFLVTGRVTLAVETVRAGEHFKRFCGLDFDVIPQPVSLPPVSSEKPGDTMLFAAYGFARHEKGSDILQAALLQLFQEHPNLPVQFLIQWKNDFKDAAGRWVTKAPELLSNPDIDFIDRAFGTAEYTEHLARTDAIILPYRQDSYYDRDSRVAIEAAVLGIPTVYTRGTWLEQVAVAMGAGIGFANESVADLARAIHELSLDLPKYREQAAANAFKAREYFSPERFQQWLMDAERAKPERRAWF